MSIWGVLPFDNSRAADWVYALSETSDLSLVALTLGRLEGRLDIPLDQGLVCEAIAACEVVARLHGISHELNEFTNLVDNWIARHSIAATSDVTAQARAVVARLLDRQPDLTDLPMTINPDHWRGALFALGERLASRD